MLTGRAPFTDEEPLAMLRAHVSLDPPPFAEVAPDLELPPGIEVVINRGLAKVSAERTSSALTCMQELDDAVRAAGYDPLMAVPRSSAQIGIPSGPHSIPTPSPGGMFMTPPPTAYGTAPGASGRGNFQTPSHGTFVTAAYTEMGSAPTHSLDNMVQQRAATSIADLSEPLGKKMKMTALVIVLAALAGAAYFMLFHDKNSGGTKTAIVAVPVANPVERETLYKAALHDLENGKTCADRKAAIPTLLQLGDPKAIPALKKARSRHRGGVLGIGSSNTNACLKSDAESAIQALGGTLK
jgi:hypothetical protein